MRVPFVSICTPTFNRRPFWESTIKCFNHQDYPKENMEWIIIDDGTDKIEDLVKDIPQVKYYSYDTKMPLGKKRNIIDLNKPNFSVRVLPLICYEIIYTGNISKIRDFDLIVNISEDGWFGQSIGPHQHFAHSAYRAIESGKYVLRSANNGIAAVVNPLGVVEKKIGLDQSGFVDLFETKKIKPTIFSKYGNKIFIIIILMYIFLIFSFNRTKNE